jgi:hypothetical protein
MMILLVGALVVLAVLGVFVALFGRDSFTKRRKD